MSKNILAAVLCVFLFSLTAPFTRLAAAELSAEAIILFRIGGAAVICFLFVFKDRWLPPKRSWFGISKAALGSVVGFNSLLAYGLKEVPSGHAAVALAALPMATAIYSVLRDKYNPGLKFWLFALVGTLLSFGFFFTMNVSTILTGDFYLLCAVLAAAFGYVEGGRVSREFGGSRVMSWAVIFTLPFALIYAWIYFSKAPLDVTSVSATSWLSLAYLAMFSQSLGMFLWFRVLAIGPMEKIALVQLLQPFFTLFGAIYLVNETVSWNMWVVALLVGACVFGSIKERTKSQS